MSIQLPCRKASMFPLARLQPGLNTRSGQAWYIWCKNLALNIGDCVFLVN